MSVSKRACKYEALEALAIAVAEWHAVRLKIVNVGTGAALKSCVFTTNIIPTDREHIDIRDEASAARLMTKSESVI